MGGGRLRRPLLTAGLFGVAVAAGVVVPAGPALAHGIGGRQDLPLPLWLFAYGAGGAIVVSFAALALLWTRSRFEEEATGRPLPEIVQRVATPLALAARAGGLGAFALVVAAGLVGEDVPVVNLAPTAIYVVFWVGFQIVSALVGDVWKVVSPFDTLAAGIERLRGRREPAERAAPGWGHWPAAALLFAFVWLELVHPDSASPRILGWAAVVYTAVVMTGVVRWGRSWLREGEAFAAWFGLLARMAPLYQDAGGKLRARAPLAGLTGLWVRPGTLALVFVALGSTSFDGLERTEFWDSIAGGRFGWDAAPVATLGLLWMIGVVALAYVGSMRWAAVSMGREPTALVPWFVHSLVPIALAYVVAHYFSLLVFQGQAAYALVSDPFGFGWDLFGTATERIDYTVVSTRVIAWVQAGAIVAGHVAGVLVAHDRAVARFDPATATRSQYPLLAAMVLYSVGGLALLLGA